MLLTCWWSRSCTWTWWSYATYLTINRSNTKCEVFGSPRYTKNSLSQGRVVFHCVSGVHWRVIIPLQGKHVADLNKNKTGLKPVSKESVSNHTQMCNFFYAKLFNLWTKNSAPPTWLWISQFLCVSSTTRLQFSSSFRGLFYASFLLQHEKRQSESQEGQLSLWGQLMRRL